MSSPHSKRRKTQENCNHVEPSGRKNKSRPNRQFPLQQNPQYYNPPNSLPTSLPPPPCSMKNLSNFAILETIGTGGYARVELVRHKFTNKYYALKVQNKKKLVDAKLPTMAIREKELMQKINFPFIVSLESHFKDTTNVYLLLEFVPGGDLDSLLKLRGHLTIELSRFYASQLVLALEYIHEIKIIHRDIKPQNVLIDRNGYIKLSDFGLADHFNSHRSGKCGTTKYMAPEVIREQPFTKAVDWWSFGILVFQMCTGKTPFYASTKEVLENNILNGSVDFPKRLSQRTVGFIRKLLHKDPRQRLGNLCGGADDVKDERFFGVCNFTTLLEQKRTAPYVPTLQGPADTSNFLECDSTPLHISLNEHNASAFARF